MEHSYAMLHTNRMIHEIEAAAENFESGLCRIAGFGSDMVELCPPRLGA